MSTHVRHVKTQLIVRRLKASSQRGFVEFGPFRFPCALGRSGISSLKREGDGATPWGRFMLLEVFYNPNAVQRPRTALPIRRIRHKDGWCDASSDRNYNRFVQHPYPASAEELWRDDGLYDVVVVLDYNLRPRRRALGSAIFMHVARPGFTPTEGCIALRRDDLLKLLAWISRQTMILTAQ